MPEREKASSRSLELVRGSKREQELAVLGMVLVLVVAGCAAPMEDLSKAPVVQTVEAFEANMEVIVEKKIDEPAAKWVDPVRGIIEEPLAAWEKVTDKKEWQALGEGLQIKIQDFFTNPADAEDFLKGFTLPEDVNNIKALESIRAEIEEELKNLSAPTPPPAE